MVAQVDFAGGRLDGQRGRNQEIVGTMHTALGRGLLVLLNSHEKLLEEYLNLAAQLTQNSEGRNLFINTGFNRRIAIIVTWHQRQGQQHLILDQRQQIRERFNLEGIFRIVFKLIFRRRFAGTEEQKTIFHFTGPLQGLKTALTLQNQTAPDPQIDVELALVVALTFKPESHRSGRLQYRLGHTAKPGYRHLTLKATPISGQRPKVDHEAFLRHKSGMILFSALCVKTLQTG